jgi:hypothetical protein
MNAADHYQEAERLLNEGNADALQRAMVHAVLAVAARLEEGSAPSVRSMASTTSTNPLAGQIASFKADLPLPVLPPVPGDEAPGLR